jgi:DnaJ-class molecular chaperone
VPDLAPTEIVALARILDDLDYYQLIHVERGAGARELKSAYYATSRAFHPDANRKLAPDLQTAVAKIAKRVTEAYSVLRDPRRRQAYDRLLESGQSVRMQLAEAEAAGRQQIETRKGRTPQGRQYYNLADADIKRRNFIAAERNLRTALTFEPDNAAFKQLLEDVRKKQR